MTPVLRTALFAALIAWMMQGTLWADPIPSAVRIRILNARHPSSLVLTTEGGKVFLPGGVDMFSGECRIALSENTLTYENKGKVVITEMVRFEGRRIRISIPDAEKRNYCGAVEVYPGKKELLIVNETPFDEYVHGAAMSESAELLAADKAASRGWEREFLSAMEICIRSFVVSNGRRHDDSRYSFCDLTHCVHFAGAADSSPLTRTAVLTDRKGRTVCSYFHSTCGGRLSSPTVLWPAAGSDTFRIGDDAAEGVMLCRTSPHYRWNTFIPMKEMEEIFGTELTDVRLVLVQDRVSALTAEFGNGETNMPIAEFLSSAGHRLGWNAVKSNDFTMTKIAEGFLFEGQGLGHGTGLCQYGAQTLAKKGWDAAKILQFYFPGSVMSKGRLL